MLGVVYDNPVESEEPPLEAVYQSKTAPEVAVADKVTVPGPILDPPEVVTTDGTALTTAVPEATFCVVAPVDAIAIFPPAPFAAVIANLT